MQGYQRDKIKNAGCPSVDIPAISPKIIVKIALPSSACMTIHAGPKIVCLYEDTKSLLIKK